MAGKGCGGDGDRHPGTSLGQGLMAPVKSTFLLIATVMN